MWWEHWKHCACNDHVHLHDEENNVEHFACNDPYSMTCHEKLNIDPISLYNVSLAS